MLCREVARWEDLEAYLMSIYRLVKVRGCEGGGGER
jgi:hypothetical protein